MSRLIVWTFLRRLMLAVSSTAEAVMAFDLAIELPESDLDENPAFLKVAGVPVLSRLILGGAAAGAETITVVGSHANAARRDLGADVRFRNLDLRWGDSAASQESHVRVRADVVVGKEVWRLLAEGQGTLDVPGAPDMSRVAGGEGRPLWMGDAPAGAYVVPVRGRTDRAEAKRAIFANVTKPTSGPISKHVNSRLSLPISKVLCEIGVTPNQMTVFTTLVGFASVWFMAQGTVMQIAIGGALFQLCAALDRVDGELARSMFMASEHGAWIDTVGDNLVYLGVLVGLNLGYYRYGLDQGWPYVDWIPVVGFGIVVLAVALIGGMAWYLKTNDQPGTMTAVQADIAKRIDPAKVGGTYRVLDSLKVLGKRDSFSFIGFFLTLLPWLMGPLGFHLLVGFVDVLIVLIIMYYVSGIMQARRAGARP